MRTDHINHLKKGTEQASRIRLHPGQIVRGKILQIYPLDRARIQIGSFTFIAQLEAPLNHGESYFFQVDDVKEEVHLRVIQQASEQRTSEWKQLLQMIGSKHSKGREQFVRQLLQSNIPFTKRTLQQMFTLLDQYPEQEKAMKALQVMAQRAWPMTREIMESIILYQTSTLTKEVNQLVESITQQSQISQSHRELIQQLELLIPEEKKTHHVFKQLFEYITSKEAKKELPLMQMLHPRIDKQNVKLLQSMPPTQRVDTLQTPERMLTYLGIHTKEDRQLFLKTLTSISQNVNHFQHEAKQFVDMWERSIQLQAVQQPNRPLNTETLQQVRDSFVRVFNPQQWSHSEQTIMRQVIPNNTHQLLQMIAALKSLETRNVEQMMHQLLEHHQPAEKRTIQTEFLRSVQHIVQNIGLSYEHSLAKEQTEQLTNSLKTLLMQFIQEQTPSSERAQSLLRFIQGMQLQTVQDTAHLLSVQLQIPAMIGSLRSDMQITFESKKTESTSIDPNYCRILFDLDLAAIKRTLIDMHVQHKQVSLLIYNDLSFIKKIGDNYEATLAEGLLKTGYELTSIRYLKLGKQESHQRTATQSFARTEGFDVKI